MKSSLLAIVGIVLSVLLFSTTQSASSQNTNSSTTQSASTPKSSSAKQRGKPKVTVLKGTRGAASRGGEADPNITQGKETNDPASQMDVPPKKGGATTRGGGYCEVQFDNRTKWYIKVYVDGIYRGTLSPYGDGVVYAQPGSTSVYARADFDDGSYYTWGPSSYSCGPGQYIPFRMVL